MRFWSSGPACQRWLRRSATRGLSLGEPLATIVPYEEEVSYEWVRESLSGHLLGELAVPWLWDDTALGVISLTQAEASRQIDAAVASGRLTLRMVFPSHTTRGHPRRDWKGTIRHLFNRDVTTYHNTRGRSI